MSDDCKSNENIKYLGSPNFTEDGHDILAYHLERYLCEWFGGKDIEGLYITVGFDHSAFASKTFYISPTETSAKRVDWTFQDLSEAHRRGANCLRFQETSTDESDFEIVSLSSKGLIRQNEVLFGFGLIPKTSPLTDTARHRFRRLAIEAICAYRRNAIRLFFDEHKTETTKSLLYEIMERLPEWFGCDHSAGFFMTSSLETMTLEAWEDAQFDVLAERLYIPEKLDLPALTPQSRPERLVGMSVDLQEETNQLLGAAVRYQRRNPSTPYQVFSRKKDGTWNRVDGSDENEFAPIHHLSNRDEEMQCILIPLVSEEAGGIVLLGFLSLAYCRNAPLPSNFEQLLPSLGDQLTSLLHHSSLYSLSARKLRLLQKARESYEEILQTNQDTESRIESLIGDVTELIAEDTDVPSFAIGYLKQDPDSSRRFLRYVHPYGWTRFNQLNLPVDIDPEERADSGVSSLAIRLNRSLVLAGGHGKGDSQRFKNYLWVNEQTTDIIDARQKLQDVDLESHDDWVPLKKYYKPARESAYATIAYPISLAGEPLGVITVEVEKPTDWTWWTGFGGQLFWSMLADTLADAFYSLRNAED